jgi:Gram-negative bacterial TonB protein C-terminal
MKALLKGFPLLFLVSATTASAQEPEVRRQAVELMERATAASVAATLPNLERIDTFRALDAPRGTREGKFTRVVVQGVGKREESSFGDYHLVQIWTNGHLARAGSGEIAPPEIETVYNITPIRIPRFDGEDVIHRIVTKAVAGKNARCIEFDTITGQKIENNEFCLDPANNALILSKTGDELVENSDFFLFAGQLIPSKITYTFAGVRKLEISQTMTELKESTENVLTAPPDAQILAFCKRYRRPIGVSMPQPKAGNGGRDIDVAIRGIIGTDGKIHEAVVQSSERADLGEEALSLVQQWVFTPGICDGSPNTTESIFMVHFHGR